MPFMQIRAFGTGFAIVPVFNIYIKFHLLLDLGRGKLCPILWRVVGLSCLLAGILFLLLDNLSISRIPRSILSP
jgi:hypothetical protein